MIITTGTALRVFDSTYTLYYGQDGGPEGAANTLVYYICRKSFFDMQWEYGATILITSWGCPVITGQMLKQISISRHGRML